VAVTFEDGSEHHKVLPTQFLLTEDGEHVTNYKVTERPSPEARSVVFLFPHSGIPQNSPCSMGALNCLAWKRTSDLWAIQTYLPEESHDSESCAGKAEGPRYLTSPEAIAAALSATARRSACADIWKSIWRAVRLAQAQARGPRHLILFCESEPERPAGSGLVSAVETSCSTVQVISAGPNPRVESFCRRVHGSFHVTETPEEVAQAVSLAYLSLLARYEISYQTACPEAHTLKVQITGPAVRAETTLTIPARVEAAKLDAGRWQ
jgi:hypothetical protein